MNFSKVVNYYIQCCIPKFKEYTWKSHVYQNVDNMDIKNAKLQDCAISSSHNSILGKLQVCTRVSLYPLSKALNYNFRMIELDIFNIGGEYKVGHGRDNNCIATDTISLEDCFATINQYGWEDTNMPLFISLELNTTKIQDLETLIYKYFANRLYKDKTKQLQDCTISELKNKIIFLSGQKLPFEPSYLLHNMSVNGHPNNLSGLVRIYPNNKVLSSNYKFHHFLPHANFISINSCYKDKYYYQYRGYFSQGIINKSKICY